MNASATGLNSLSAIQAPHPSSSSALQPMVTQNIKKEIDTLAQLREDGRQKEKLLLAAQSQIRELLPLKERAAEYQAQLMIAQQKLSDKDGEVQRLQLIMTQERRDFDSIVGGLNAKLQRIDASAQNNSTRLEEQIKDAAAAKQQLSLEVQRKTEALADMERQLKEAVNETKKIRDLYDDMKMSGTRQRGELDSLRAKHDEELRENTKLDAANAALEKQQKQMEQQNLNLRDEVEALKKKRNELMGECTKAQVARDALTEHVHSLTAEVQVIPSLRGEVSQLLACRDELQSLRQGLEESNNSLLNEKSMRRTAEMQSEQAVLQAQSMVAEIEQLKKDLHQAQCDAAGRMAMQRELSEMSDALTVSQRTNTQLQQQLVDLKNVHTTLQSQLEATESQLVGETGALRRVLEECYPAPTNRTTAPTPQPRQFPVAVNSASVTSHFFPLLTAARELQTVLGEERDRSRRLEKQLADERENAAKLHSECQGLTRANNELRTNLTALEGQEKQTQVKLENTTQELRTLHQTTSQYCSKLLMEFGEQGGTWDLVQQHVVRAVAERRALKAELGKLQPELQQMTAKLAEVTRTSKVDLEQLRDEFRKQCSEMTAQHASEMSTAVATQQALKDTLAKAVSRHDDVVTEAKKLERAFEATTRALSAAKESNDAQKAQIVALEQKLSEVSSKLRSSEVNATQSADALARSQQDVREVQMKLNKEEAKVAEAKLRNEGLFWNIFLVVRGIVGALLQRRVIVAERNAMISYSRILEQSLSILQESLHPNARRHASFRAAAVCVLAHHRFVKIAAQRKLNRRDQAKVAPLPSKLLFRNLRLSTLGNVTAPLASEYAVVEVTSQSDAEQLDSLASLLSQFQFRVDSPNKTELGSIAYRVCRGPSTPSPVKLARTISTSYRTHIETASKEADTQRKINQSLEGEMASLREAVATRDQKSQTLTKQLSDLVEKQEREMVDGRLHQTALSELETTRSFLERHVAERKALEDRYAALQRREIALLTQNNQLQNEARSLAVELATTTQNRSNALDMPTVGGDPGRLDLRRDFSAVITLQSPSQPSTPNLDAVELSRPRSQHGNSPPTTTSQQHGRGGGSAAYTPSDLLEMIRQMDQKLGTVLNSSMSSQH